MAFRPIRIIDAGHKHFAILERALDYEKASAVGDPGLVPDFSGSVVDAETFAVGTLCVLIVFVQDTAIENTGDLRASDWGLFILIGVMRCALSLNADQLGASDRN